MKSLKFFKPALTPYLFVALLFASFAVAQSVQAEVDEGSLNVAESAAMRKGANQRKILISYTTDPILCCFNEQVKLHGKIRISFKKNGRKAAPTVSLANLEGVGLTTKREYVADQAMLKMTRIHLSPGLRALLPPDFDSFVNLIIPVTGKHPTDLNSATGDPLPGKDVHFQLVYNVGWKSLNGQFISNPVNNNKGVITCN